ncbi:Galactokinase, conserved site,Galactokinase,Galactokinase galactose-binding [Cinara cedri]|uniref:Galactokinase, conserved site,Galactokinase,Galactokinase galactose-binding n=1 Tax=Cinara cedri TaxID=506608 RepID=A0A5E4M160_9HEMI|nr:Galactokinase, conserved site,Galactokinase,Galactokinase galactose-binding [Cinara cedri]
MDVDYTWETATNNAVSIQKLEEHFRKNFSPYQPEYYIKVPGRVNLIGEHVDYCGYSVFSMAIEQCIVVAAKRINDQPTVQLTNLSSERYENVSKNILDISVDSLSKSPHWSNNFLCGVKGAREHLIENELIPGKNVGFLFAVTGNIPENSGLSSSSALVTAAVMATLVGYGVCSHQPIKVSRSQCQVQKIYRNSQQWSGSSDSSECQRRLDQKLLYKILTHACYASRIDFNPMMIKQYHLPSDVKFIVAQSLVVKNKTASNDFHTRVVECKLASQIIAKRLNLTWKHMTVLATLQKNLGNTLDQMIELVHQNLHVDGYSKKEICEILNVSENELDELSLTPNTIHVTEFFLHQRALHVFEEAKRMEMFCDLCENSGTTSDLGQLMNESHSSLRDLYQCSHPDLEELVDVCKRGHAFGCKLTGGGWGGCVVAMVPSASADEFVEFVKDQFYSKRNFDEKCIFATNPSEGACAYLPSEAQDGTPEFSKLVHL